MADLYLEVLAASMGAFFIVASVMLLSRYRNLVERVERASGIIEGLWESIESRLHKQDERILELAMKYDVIATRQASQSLGKKQSYEESKKKVAAAGEAASIEPSTSRSQTDSTERIVLNLLSQRPMTSVEIKNIIKKSREHTARLMKLLHDRGLVSRDSTKRPFLYSITEKGRAYLSAA